MSRTASARLVPTSAKGYAVLAADLASVAAAWLASYLLRFNLEIPAEYLALALRSLLWVVPIYGAAFLAMGMYRGMVRFSSLPDLLRIGRAVALAAAVVALVAYLTQADLQVPRSVIVLSPILTLLVVGGTRAAYRAWRESREPREAVGQRRRLFVLGTGEPGARLLRELATSPQWQVVGAFDDRREAHGREIHGVPVLGPLADVEQAARELDVRDAVIAMPEASSDRRQQAATICMRAGLNALMLPALADLIEGRVTIENVRRINLEDLLGRDAVRINSAEVGSMLGGAVVMVTGAGGSIGSELCRQVARFAPARLVFFEHSEFALYRIGEEFRGLFPEVPFVGFVGDVKDAERVREVIAAQQPAIVFHAAAYKHVPLMEDDNCWQAVRNNVFGTWVVAAEAVAARVPRFVLVSTDKAVNPSNVMGATKRLAEIACQAVQPADGATLVSIVRFGNVLGSAGSVIPKFQEQVARGGPVTVTHAEATRYFMSIPEASQLVLQAAALGDGGQIFVLEMGKPVRILDVAKTIIQLSGRSEEEIEIRFTGLRPGEKLHEEVFTSDELTDRTSHPSVRVAKARPVDISLEALLEGLRVPVRDDEQAREFLRSWVPEYGEARNDEPVAS
ncbi:MAG: polysaccharide biosynthesis protein [Burkholderiales bacterium]|nr:polysaccharide biosynthesis protein [Burkholderiales bacterium]